MHYSTYTIRNIYHGQDRLCAQCYGQRIDLHHITIHIGRHKSSKIARLLKTKCSEGIIRLHLSTLQISEGIIKPGVPPEFTTGSYNIVCCSLLHILLKRSLLFIFIPNVNILVEYVNENAKQFFDLPISYLQSSFPATFIH